jgi:hypothetical protein
MKRDKEHEEYLRLLALAEAGLLSADELFAGAEDKRPIKITVNLTGIPTPPERQRRGVTYITLNLD